MRNLNDNPKVKELRLVLVVHDKGDSLVSLALREELASKGPTVCQSVPRVHVGEKEERQACERAGFGYDGSWPGWDVMFDWLDGLGVA